MTPTSLPARLNAARRHGAALLDGSAARTWRAMRGGGPVLAFDGEPRFALLSVNYSTTHWLKLMLRSLVELQGLAQVRAVVICDNGSRDGGADFLRRLARRAGRVVLVENRWWTHHARGMRLAIEALQAGESNRAAALRTNLFWFVDPDVVFLRHDTLLDLGRVFSATDAAFAGELRRHVHPLPEAQASFLAVRRDWAERRDVSPWIHGGSPAWPLQRDIWRAGGRGVHFPAYSQAYAVHRGRAAVAAARDWHPRSAYAGVADRAPHFMGIKGAETAWAARAAEFASYLEPQGEDALLDLLSERLA